LSCKNFIARDKPKAAAKWARTAYTEMRSLRYFPMRNEVIPEADEIRYPYRHIIFGNYRIIYKVEENFVTVVRVIQASRLLHVRFFSE
jgi:plasmid stabilization system protein ParE